MSELLWIASHLHVLSIIWTSAICYWGSSKATSDDSNRARRNVSCHSYFGRWNKMPGSSGRTQELKVFIFHRNWLDTLKKTSENHSEANRDNASYKSTNIKIDKVQMTNVKCNFTINEKVSKVNKQNLISPVKPCYEDIN